MSINRGNDQITETRYNVGGNRDLPSKKDLVLILIGVFFISFSVLMFEITLMRIFSVILTYHYVFMVVSLALLGLGLGGLLVHYCRRQCFDAAKGPLLSPMVAALFAVSAAGAVILIIKLPIVGSVLIYFVISVVPFTFAGALFAKVFHDLAGYASKIYFADLIGAALGSLGVLFIMGQLGGINTGLLASVTAALGALFVIASAPLRRYTKNILTGLTALPISFFVLKYACALRRLCAYW